MPPNSGKNGPKFQGIDLAKKPFQKPLTKFNLTELNDKLLSEKQSRNYDDYTWVYDDQPHTDRRKYMSEKYPAVKELFGTDEHFRHVVTAEVLFQVFMCYLLQDSPWWLIVLCSYTIGGVINHSLTLAIHDIGHNTAFGNTKPNLNRWFSCWANLPIGVPSAVTFKKYHIDHHRYLGGITSEGHLLDTDTPSPWEGRFFRGRILKAIWMMLNPLFYGLRPMFTSPKPLTKFEFYNICTCVTFDTMIFYLYGFKSLAYLLIGTLLVLGLHPCSGHFIAEHYNFLKNSETYSYYGPLNRIMFNVGYHIEHHDFPYIPGSRYPLLKKMMPEMYVDLPYISSWCNVIYDYIMDPAIGPFSRIHRIYDMKTGEMLGLKEDRLRKVIDKNREYTKKENRNVHSISNFGDECRQRLVEDRTQHIASCIRFTKYFET